MQKIPLLICVLFLSNIFCFSQGIVRGKITNTKGEPIERATVKVSGEKFITLSKSDGSFEIKYIKSKTLEVSAMGAIAATVPINSTDLVTIVLVTDTKGLPEVVLTGYTTQQRRNTVSSISKVSGDEVKSQPIGSFEQLLQGKSPGLLIQSQSGQPGSASTVTIRGKGSVLGTTQPLYILDGIEITAADFQSLNPSDFESYNILKDAIGTSQYGSRGANGVIVVTSKKGTNAKTRIAYDYQYGISQLPDNKLRLLNSAEKIFYELNYDRPDGLNPFGWSANEADSLSKINAGWEKAMFRKAITQQHQLSVNGGNEKTKFFISGSVFDQQGLVVNTALKRYSGRVNLDHSAGNFKISLNSFLGYSKSSNTNENDQFIGSPLNAIRWTNPYATPYNADGTYNLSDVELQGQPNPLQEQNENSNLNTQLKGVAVAGIEYRVPMIKGLSLKTNWGIDYTNDLGKVYFDKTTYSGSQQTGGRGSFNQSTTVNSRVTGTTSINYNKKSNSHNFNISVFHEIIKNNLDFFSYRGYGLIGPFKNGAGITPGTSTNGFIPTVGSFSSIRSLLSYFAIADYGYQNKYFITATFRNDGSSRLAKGNQFTQFGSIGASWLATREGFFKNTRWLNELKFKASYGSSGNQGVGDSYEALEQFGPAAYNGIPAIVLTNFKKSALGWEVRKTFNAGVDFSLIKNRISGSIEYYNGTTDKLYLDRQISGTNGANTILTNLGKLRNSGIELSLNVTPVQFKNFNWSVEANYTINKSKVLQLDGTKENINGTAINRVGEAANSIYVVRFAGVDPATGDALYFKKDGKGLTNVYDPNDRVIVGNYDPTNFGGLTNTFNFKGFELSALFTFSAGNKIYNNDRVNVENPAYWYSSLSSVMLTEWQKPGQVTNIPSPFNDFQANTTRFIESGDFIRLRNVMLSYTFSTHLLAKAKISSARLFVQMQNIKTWHSFQGWDPEVASGLLGGAQYPALKAITFGLNVSL